jgi:hypothetical protein
MSTQPYSNNQPVQIPRPFQKPIDQSPTERASFDIGKTADGNYNIVASVFTYRAAAQTQLASYLLNEPPSVSGQWMQDHIFEKIYIKEPGKENAKLSPNTLEKTQEFFEYIYKNGKTFHNLGENLLIYV